MPIAILILWMFPKWQVAGATLTDKERLELIDKTRGTLAQILAGAGIAIGLYFTWRRVAAAERTVQVEEEGQITERFTRVIDQLGATDEQGNKRLEIRFGGIYALERIARDSEKDHWPIMEVLTAYVREQARWQESSPQQQDQPQDSAALSSENATQQQDPQARPAPDIQAILTVIGRRPRWYGEGEDQLLDLSNTDLRGADLYRAHLERANLYHTHLEGANPYRAHLEGVDLSGAHLERATPVGAHLEGADLSGAHGLTQEQVDSAYTDENTLLPDYLIPSQAAGENA
jgi:hypothetical protein